VALALSKRLGVTRAGRVDSVTYRVSATAEPADDSVVQNGDELTRTEDGRRISTREVTPRNKPFIP